jgi:hypothetical protein
MFSGHAEPAFPRGTAREEVRKWRLSVPISHFKDLRKKYNDGGVTIHAYNYSFREDYTNDEIARGFEFADALGAKIITASSNVTTAKKVDPFAKKAKIRVGMHNHSRIVANVITSPGAKTPGDGFGHLDAGGAMHASFDHALVHLRHNFQHFRRLTGNDLGDVGEGMFAIARIDALRRVAHEKIDTAAQARVFFEHRHAVFFGSAGINGRFKDHNVTALQHAAHGFRGP